MLVDEQGGSTAQHAGLRILSVAGQAEVDRLVSVARAELAVLRLEARAARQDADAAVRREHDPDLGEARVLLAASLEAHLGRRRAEMAAELERARRAAADRVDVARRSAADLVAEASQRTLAALLAGTASTNGLGHEGRSSSGATQMAQGGVAPPATAEIIAGAEAPGSPRDVAAAPAAVGLRPPVPGVSPLPPPPAGLAATVPAATMPAVPELDGARLDGARLDDARLSADAVIVDPAPAPAEPAPAPAEAQPPAAVGEAAAAEPGGPSRSRLRTMLYLDVLLPMVAVVLLLVVLLAWVG